MKITKIVIRRCLLSTLSTKEFNNGEHKYNNAYPVIKPHDEYNAFALDNNPPNEKSIAPIPHATTYTPKL